MTKSTAANVFPEPVDVKGRVCSPATLWGQARLWGGVGGPAAHDLLCTPEEPVRLVLAFGALTT